MIRVFITTLLYIITMLTQPQKKTTVAINRSDFHVVDRPYEDYMSYSAVEDFKAYEFNNQKFEERNKDLTFEIGF